VNLKELLLNKCPEIVPEGLKLVLEGCSILEHLELEGNLADDFSFLLEGKNLKRLNLKSCPNISEKGFSIFSGLPNLIELSLMYCSGVSDAVLEYLKDGCPNLETLDISNCQITDQGIQSLSELHNLQQLTMISTAITDAGLKLLIPKTGICLLKELDLKYCVKLTEQGLKMIRDASPFLALLTWSLKLDSIPMLKICLINLGENVTNKNETFHTREAGWRQTINDSSTASELSSKLKELEIGMPWSSVNEKWRELRPIWIGNHPPDIDSRQVAKLALEFEECILPQSLTEKWTILRTEWIDMLKEVEKLG